LDATCSQICGCSSTLLKFRVLGLSYGLKLTSWLSIHLHIQVLNSNMFRSLPPISKWVLGVEGESLKFVQWFKWRPLCEWQACILELPSTHHCYFVYISQACGVVAYIFTCRLFIVVYRVQAMWYYLEGCSPPTIEISMSCVISSWGSFSYGHWDFQQALCMWWEHAFLTINVIVLWKPRVVLQEASQGLRIMNLVSFIIDVNSLQIIVKTYVFARFLQCRPLLKCPWRPWS